MFSCVVEANNIFQCVLKVRALEHSDAYV